jgi:chemotaxis protein methyltransferase CheR
MTDDAQALEQLLETLFRLSGADFRRYRRASLLRRVLWRVHEENAGSITRLIERVAADRECLQRLRAALTLHVTSMFRDPGLFVALRHQTALLRTFPHPRIWVAACSTGQELYSLLILLEEEALLRRCTVFATDLSAAAIAQARTGSISRDDMAQYQAAYLQAGGKRSLPDYFADAGPLDLTLKPGLLSNVVFEAHDLLGGASFNEFQLVMCRNVLMYLDEIGQQRAHALLHDSLSPLGLLCLGMGESLMHCARRADYASLDRVEPIYQRLR